MVRNFSSEPVLLQKHMRPAVLPDTLALVFHVWDPSKSTGEEACDAAEVAIADQARSVTNDKTQKKYGEPAQQNRREEIKNPGTVQRPREEALTMMIEFQHMCGGHLGHITVAKSGT